MTHLWQRLLHHSTEALPVVPEPPKPQVATRPTSEWEPVPLYLEIDPKENVIPALIAASVATTSVTDSKLVLKHLYVQNPEAQLVSVIASSCATAVDDGHFVVKSIRKRVDQH
ncbi:hypothetical protein D1831_11530 [Lactiplantibacillus garii]|uniref:Uncharacterized protein n=1 Tax=Lactiplantibacillus garii TaxID=2306423 RepID=A0A426D4W2_9LACO|nr:hypothetical protein [Lactiplantibacillus garii]RRK09631.1 hypothetical protein D1831_11530 [Lactiplantibacillus garii]